MNRIDVIDPQAPQTADLVIRRTVILVVLVAGTLVAFDTGGLVRVLVTVVALLVAPGLAASLSMGPMSIEARALISLTASAAVVTVVATTLALVGWWSPGTGFIVVGLLAIGLALVPFRTGGTSGRDSGLLTRSTHTTTKIDGHRAVRRHGRRRPTP